ncbi:MAG: serine hydrolase [Bacteroidota bacterium]
MLKYISVIVLLCASYVSSCAQPQIKAYQGNWEGELPHAQSFSFRITVEDLSSNSYQIKIANHRLLVNKRLESTADDHIHINLDAHTRLNLYVQEDRQALSGFLTSGILMYHLVLDRTGDNTYAGSWNPLMVDQLHAQSIFLSVETYEDGSFATYPFWGDQRFTGTWCGGFSQEGELVFFRDLKTGMRFQAKLLEDNIQLDIFLADAHIARSNLTRSESDWEFGTMPSDQAQQIDPPSQLNDGWPTRSIHDFELKEAPLARLMDSIDAGKLPNTHSVLIAKKGNLIFEAYFDGYHPHIPHDQRSASKSVSSAMIGIAIDEGIIQSIDQRLYDFIPQEYQYTKDSLKSEIRLKDLLTMSSGLDVNGMASEGTYQETNHWLKTVLEAPMIEPAGTRADYGSANPFLLGVCLDQGLEQAVEMFMDQHLLTPLGINNYIIQTENTGTSPYFGGGMYLTPRDMLKFGQLYLNGGKWKGQQIISQSWVAASFKQYGRLQDVKDKNEYGYQWWHKTYELADKEIESIEARGAGGQYIFVIPVLESVVVITSGNYRNRQFLQQPETILEDYILPALTK